MGDDDMTPAFAEGLKDISDLDSLFWDDGPGFDSDQFGESLGSTKEDLKGQGEEANVADAMPVNEAGSSRESPAGPLDEENQAQSEPQASVEDLRETPHRPEATRQNNSNGQDQQETDLPTENPPHELGTNDFIQAEEDASRSRNVDSTNLAPYLNQGQVDSPSRNRESLPVFDDVDAKTLIGDDQEDDGLVSDQQPLEFRDIFNSLEWQEYARQDANKEFVKSIGIGMQEEQSINHQQEQSPGLDLPAVETPAEASVRDTTVIDDTAIEVQISAPPGHVVNGVRYSSPGSMPGPSNTTIAADNPTMHQNNKATDEVEAEQDSEQGLIDVYYADEPMIEEDEAQDGYGRTGKIYGQELWFNPEENHWQPSASHHDMRATLIAEAQAEYPDYRYLHPDPTHGIPNGETAFFKTHQNRGPTRDQCADELFVWRGYTPKKDESGKYKRKAKADDNWKHPGFMMENGKILLDPHNNPVVNHDFIPLTLSPYTDAGKLQEMALHRGCRQVDLWARMPRWEKKNIKNDDAELVPLRGVNSRINMPMTRFREKKGTIAGGDREGTGTIMAGLEKFYRSHGFDPVAAGNPVKSFPRDLEPWEVKEVRLGNTAKFGERAGGRALNDDKRQETLRKTKQAIENGKRKQAAKDEGGAVKRRHEAEDSGSEDAAPGPQKRRRRGQEVNPGSDQQSYGHNRAPTVKGSQYGYGGHRNPHHPRHIAPQAPPQMRSSPQHAPEAPFGASFNPVQNAPRPAPHSRMPMQTTRSPYENLSAMNPPRDTNIYRNSDRPSLYPPPNPSIVSGPAFGRGQPGQPPHVVPYSGNRHAPAPQIRRNHQAMPNIAPENQFPVQRQQPLGGTNAVPNQTGNTLGPGGRKLYQASKKVLGKRRQHEVVEIVDEEDSSPGTQQQSHKRQRNNGAPGTEPRPQRRPHPERTSRPRHYGAVGAPVPLMPQENILEAAQQNSVPNADENEQPASLEEMLGEINDFLGNQNQMPAAHGSTDQSMRGPPSHPSHAPQPPQNIYTQPPQYIHPNGAPTNTGYTPQRADAQGPALPPAPLPAQTEQQAPPDMRDVRPADEQQSQSLHRALEYTREIYRVFTNEEPPVTNLEDCYNRQYGEIWATFRDWWFAEKNPNRSLPMPQLWRMPAWGGSVQEWKAP